MRQCYLPNVNGTKDLYECYTVNEFPYHKLLHISIKGGRKNSGVEYLTNICAYDIETTTLVEEQIGFMYHWQMCIDGIVCYGRTWKEWEQFLNTLTDTLHINENRRLVIWVHNLGFEYQFMKQFLKRLCTHYDVFAAQPRKPMKTSCNNGLEFRCSWKLSNMSLEKFVQNEKGTSHYKMKGDLDYRKIRTPETPLDDTEFAYCIADVVTLYEAIRCRLMNEKDNLSSIPLTSTGYVRRDCRKNISKSRGYRQTFLNTRLCPATYTMLKETAAGGDTHASRKLSGKVIEDVDSYDVQSSYPAMMLLRKFPMTKFTEYGDIESLKEFDEVLSNHACLFHLTLIGVRMKDYFASPYIHDSKCHKLLKPILDNGRVLEAEGLTLTTTDIDFKIIREQYEWDEIYVSDMRISEYGYLPEALLETVRYYYDQKCELKYQKEVLEKEDKTESEEYINTCYLYGKMKNRLNGIFGMCFTDPIHDIISELEDGSWKAIRPENIEELLDKYYKSRNSFLSYAWGVWVTAHARAHLHRLINAAGQQATIYNDTDSDKAYHPDHAAIEKENVLIREECDKRKAYSEVNGTRYYLGVYEHETLVPLSKFKTLGAKKYVYLENDKLHVTISGVNKEKGPAELKSIDNFDIGFEFKEAGGLEMVYNEAPIHTITVDSVKIETASNIASLDSTYTIGITGEYCDLIGYNPVKYKQYKETKNEKTRKRNSKNAATGTRNNSR